jgi:fumarate hydratase subunit beta
VDKRIRIETPFTKEAAMKLKAGDVVEINGIIYAARDAAHRKMIEMLDQGKELPFDIKDQIIYYVGPCPARPGSIIGSAGPTTSGRMDAYAPSLIELGLTGMIGKGLRSKQVIDAMIRNGAVYFGAVGGAGALLSRCIIAEEITAFQELGTEALRKLTVRNFPATVVIDSKGNDLYQIGKEKFRIMKNACR